MTPNEINEALALAMGYEEKPLDYYRNYQIYRKKGTQDKDGQWMFVEDWNPYEDRNHLAIVLDEVEQRELIENLCIQLWKALGRPSIVDTYSCDICDQHYEPEWEGVFSFMTAPPAVVAKAALEVLGDE